MRSSFIKNNDLSLFGDLTNLKELNLTSMFVSKLTAKDLKDLKNLKKLIMHLCSLKYLDFQAFCKLENSICMEIILTA